MPICVVNDKFRPFGWSVSEKRIWAERRGGSWASALQRGARSRSGQVVVENRLSLTRGALCRENEGKTERLGRVGQGGLGRGGVGREGGEGGVLSCPCHICGAQGLTLSRIAAPQRGVYLVLLSNRKEGAPTCKFHI